MKVYQKKYNKILGYINSVISRNKWPFEYKYLVSINISFAKNSSCTLVTPSLEK